MCEGQTKGCRRAYCLCYCSQQAAESSEHEAYFVAAVLLFDLKCYVMFTKLNISEMQQHTRDIELSLRVYSHILLGLRTQKRAPLLNRIQQPALSCITNAKTHISRLWRVCVCVSPSLHKAQTVLACTHTFPNDSSKITQEAYQNRH